MCEAIIYTNLVLYCSDIRLVTCIVQCLFLYYYDLQVNPHEQINRMQPSVRCTVPLCSQAWSGSLVAISTVGNVTLIQILGYWGQPRVRDKKRYIAKVLTGMATM